MWRHSSARQTPDAGPSHSTLAGESMAVSGLLAGCLVRAATNNPPTLPSYHVPAHCLRGTPAQAGALGPELQAPPAAARWRNRGL